MNTYKAEMRAWQKRSKGKKAKGMKKTQTQPRPSQEVSSIETNRCKDAVKPESKKEVPIQVSFANLEGVEDVQVDAIFEDDIVDLLLDISDDEARALVANDEENPRFDPTPVGTICRKVSSSFSEVDVEDDEIMNMWKNESPFPGSGNDALMCYECTPTFNDTRAVVKKGSLFDEKGWSQTLQEMKQMKASLEQQSKMMSMLQKHVLVARSA